VDVPKHPVESIRRVATASPEVRAIYVFGSQAVGRARPDSDLDLGRASAFLALDIVRGERVFCRDATETDRFELYVLRRAGDLLPFERQRQALLLAPP